MSYADHRPALRLSTLPATRVDFLPNTGRIWLACPRCNRWVTTTSKKGRVIATHRAADDVTRCKYSGLRLEVDLAASEHAQRRALGVAETSQRRAVYSNRRANVEPRIPVPGPLTRRPGGPTRPQTAGWSGHETAFTGTDQTWNTARRAPRNRRPA